MPSLDITKYFDATENRPIRGDLIEAVKQVGTPKIAIDCGCGAGADIQYLSSLGFKVYGFDVEPESIFRCTERFKYHENVILSEATFSSFEYPNTSIVVADASLFFCPKSEFADVWRKIYECLNPNGIFCGSFLGPDDTMAGPHYDHNAFWPNVTVFEEDEVRELFVNYEILQLKIHKTSGITAQGISHDWHIFSVIAKKNQF